MILVGWDAMKSASAPKELTVFYRFGNSQVFYFRPTFLVPAGPGMGVAGLAQLAVFGQRHAFGGYRRSGDVTVQAFQLGAFIGFGGHPCMQREACHLAHRGYPFPKLESMATAG